MQTFAKYYSKQPSCASRPSFLLHKLASEASPLCLNKTAASASAAVSSRRAFSGYEPRSSRSPGGRSRRTSNRKNSRSPGRSPDSQGVHPPQKFHQSLPRFVNQQDQDAQSESGEGVFAHDSTFTLVKKLMIYKMMGSNLFINHSLFGINMAYKVLGTRLTNLIVEQTAGSVFTGGVTVADLN